MTFVLPGKCKGPYHNIRKHASPPSKKKNFNRGTLFEEDDGLQMPPSNISYNMMGASFPPDGFDFTVMVYYDELFLEHAADGNEAVAFDIVGKIMEHAAFYFRGEFAAKSLGTKLHFLVEDIQLWKGLFLWSQSRFFEYLQ